MHDRITTTRDIEVPTGRLNIVVGQLTAHVSDWEAAKRGRESRARIKLSIRKPSIPIFWDRFIEVLIVSGNLTEAEALTPENVIAAAAEIIAEWCDIGERDIEILKNFASRVTRKDKKPG